METWDILDSNKIKTGKFVERGRPMKAGEYHLVVFAFIKNKNGDFLISNRTPNKTFPNKWEIPGGAAIQGDDSLTAILREVKEELGVVLSDTNGKINNSTRCETGLSYFADVWLFEQEIDITTVICQPEEVSQAKFSSKEEILRLMKINAFIKSELILNCLESIL
jgi:8-oxo-dGTP pyrophosphatase MutT (NUDIX family)